MRPLPEDMMKYAAHDPYYLIYISKEMISKIEDKNVIAKFHLDLNKKIQDLRYQIRDGKIEKEAYR